MFVRMDFYFSFVLHFFRFFICGLVAANVKRFKIKGDLKDGLV